jgi:hypothetical protein
MNSSSPCFSLPPLLADKRFFISSSSFDSPKADSKPSFATRSEPAKGKIASTRLRLSVK